MSSSSSSLPYVAVRPDLPCCEPRESYLILGSVSIAESHAEAFSCARHTMRCMIPYVDSSTKSLLVDWSLHSSRSVVRVLRRPLTRAQGTKADYERAETLGGQNRRQGLQARVQPTGWPGTTVLVPQRPGGRGQRVHPGRRGEGARESRRSTTPSWPRPSARSLGQAATGEHLPFERIADRRRRAQSTSRPAARRGDSIPRANALKKRPCPRTRERPTRAPVSRADSGPPADGSPRAEDSPDGKWHVS